MNDSARATADGAYFEELYRAYADPWHYATSPYELEKYRISLAALPRDRYASALEIGCSIGVMTAMLAPRCDRLLALDTAATAVQRAGERCQHLPHVRVEQRQLPGDFPSGAYDLIVLSETGYYLADEALCETAQLIVAGLVPGGRLLLVHHTAPIDDATMSGDAVHETFVTTFSAQLDTLVSRRHERFRLDVLQRRSG